MPLVQTHPANAMVLQRCDLKIADIGFDSF